MRSSLKREYSTELGGLGYPGFAYFNAKPRHNPAEVLFDALNQSDLDARAAEGLPWLLLKYSDVDWNWLVRNVNLHDRQNRLGFAVNLAKDVAERTGKTEVGNCLLGLMDQLEQSRLAKEDTFCHESMAEAERKWLRVHRPAAARHWNLLTDLYQESNLNTAPKADMIPEPWLSFLRDPDSAVTGEVRMDCMGGFVMTLVYGFSRTTGDLDVLELAPRMLENHCSNSAWKAEHFHKKHKIYIHYVAVANVPEDYEQRMTELFPGTFKQLRLYVLDSYDQALSKLERNNQRDRDDVVHLAPMVPLDLEVLESRYQKEMRYKMGRPRPRSASVSQFLSHIGITSHWLSHTTPFRQQDLQPTQGPRYQS